MQTLTDELMNILEVLFSTFPPLSGAETREGAIRAMQAYAIALKDYQLSDIANGIDMLIAGKVPEHDGRFVPTAPIVAKAVRRALEARLDSERRSNPPRALPAPIIEHTPESQARVRAMTAKLVADLGAAARTEDAARNKLEKERAERETRWLRDRGDLVEVKGAAYPISHALAKQLGIGDPEGDRDVA